MSDGGKEQVTFIGLSPKMQRVPVISPDGLPLMPTKASRARRWLNEGKAKIYSNDLNVFAIQLVGKPSGHETQDVVIGIDPGKLFSGVGVQSSKTTLLKLHLILPFPNVTKKMTARRILRRARRGRRINRKLPYDQRCHRAKRFDNRVQKKLPPSIRSNRQLELRVIKEIMRLFPVSNIVYEYIKARGDKGFSPAMVGQKVMLQWLSKIAPTDTRYGWQTSNLRQWLKLPKDKTDKSKAVEETHSNDGVALAASHFIKWREWQSSNARGGCWEGEVIVTPAPFKVIAKPNIYRRQLHFENPDSHKPNPSQYRKRKGGTITPFGFRSGDFVQAEKASQIYRGWIGGYTQTGKSKNISVYNHEWKRIGQFSPTKIKLLKRSCKLCVA
ncbi:hypothetical protein Mic7113_0487 [Allocoleopsis franciscana PCC 7113]|uniref:RRXRR domain-containing protein n=1 Tax=Allocoleopsis franciscana PCC 7113 TaxID=1173027 RepID=K9W7N8_9CYAN|nr:hypothetical protein Mic7113_0487 [Allocoleopsis franciscana PCC 7113]